VILIGSQRIVETAEDETAKVSITGSSDRLGLTAGRLLAEPGMKRRLRLSPQYP
jgi:hypothetical protein